MSYVVAALSLMTIVKSADKVEDKPFVPEKIFLPFIYKARFEPTGSYYCSHIVPFVEILARINLPPGKVYNFDLQGSGVNYER